MKRLFVFVASALVLTGLTACYKNPTVSIPPPQQRTYISNAAFSAGVFGVNVYASPLGPTSVPLFTLGAGNGIANTPSALAFDGHGHIFILSQGAHSVYVFTLPISPTSTPAFTMTDATLVNAFNMTFDAAGNLWVSDSGTNLINEYTPPFGAGAIAAATTISGPATTLSANAGLAFDKLGNLFVANQSTGTVLVFAPPPTGAGVISPAPISTITAGPEPEQIAFDQKDRMFLSDFSNGNVYVVNPPFATGPAPAFHISPPFLGASGAVAVTFDATGLLYVSYYQPPTGGISVFAPPFSATTAPQFIIGQPGQPTGITFGF